MDFIDSHVHFWDRTLMPYAWLHEVPSIAHRHTLDDIRREAEPEFPEKIVFVEAGAPWLDEVKWVEQLAQQQEPSRIAGIVAKMTMDAVTQTSAALAEARQHPLIRGVRHMFEHESDPDFCARPEFVAGIMQLADANLSFDLCCKHPQLPAVVELVRRCPEISFILDHAGKPGIRAGLIDPWRDHIRTLSRFPNVVCKLSGLVNEADHQQWTVAQLHPYVSHLLETFGPSRLLFGGDWPVSKLASSYRRWFDAARELTSLLSSVEQSAIFRDNAARVYRL